MQKLMRRIIPVLVFCLPMADDSVAAGFRCGTKLVVAGDPVSRLLSNCGEPRFRFKAREVIGKRGGGKAASVTNWIYDRGRKRDVVVSVYGGKVVKITYD